MKKRQEGMKIACVQSRVSRADGDTECKKIFLGKVVFSKDPKEGRESVKRLSGGRAARQRAQLEQAR